MTKQPPSPPVFDAACCAPLVTEPLTATQATTLAPMFRALGDPIRLRLLSLIASHRGEVCVCDLTPRFAVTGPTISHHLKVLREAGLIDCERRGTWVYYWLRPGVLEQLSAVLDADELRKAASSAGAPTGLPAGATTGAPTGVAPVGAGG